MTRTRTPRRGVGSIWALVVLSVVSALSVAAVARFSAARREIDHARHRAQAEWLARSGYELAVAKILAKPDGYPGETLAPIPASELKIAVTTDPKDPALYTVVSTARYPLGDAKAAVQTVRRAVRRVETPAGVRLDPRPDPAAP